MTELADRILTVITRKECAQDITTYFTEFNGRHFEALGGGGDAPAVRDRVTAEDIVAVSMLSVEVPPEHAFDLLEGTLGRKLNECLRSIPTTVALGDQEAARLVEVGSAAEKAWSLLKTSHGIDFVIAGKIMARKRPHLLPVYDNVVRCIFGWPEGVWSLLNEAVANPLVREQLDQLAESAPSQVSRLRLLDVALWMSHRNHKPGSNKSCPHFRAFGLSAAQTPQA